MDVGYYMLIAASAGTYWWKYMRMRPSRRPHSSEWRDVLDPDAEVALHVADHQAKSRNQLISSAHMLYGLIQDEAIAAAIERAGGVVATLEDRVLATLDGRTETPDDLHREASRWLTRVASVAQGTNRRATCTDFWAYLQDREATELIQASGVARFDVLFVLVHGTAQDLAAIGAGDVHVVVRNDDYTTAEFVGETLVSVFGLPEPDARAKTQRTHAEGRSVVARCTPADARTKITEARRLAKARGFPLWIGVEPT